MYITRNINILGLAFGSTVGHVAAIHIEGRFGFLHYRKSLRQSLR
jgi:hypothetical protein